MLLAVFAFANVALYVSYAYLFFWDAGFIAIKPLYWYLATIVAGAGLIATHRACWTPSRPVIALLIWCGVFAALISFSYFLSSQGPAALQVTIKYSEAMLIMAVMALILQAEGVHRWARLALIVTVLLSVAVNLVDFLSLIGFEFSSVGGRAAGFYENPNISGKFLVLGMVLALPILKKALRFPFCLVVGLGVALTFSRSAMLMWAIAIFGLSWFEAFVMPRIQSLSAISAALVLLTVTLAAGQWVGMFEGAGADNLLNENTRSRIGGNFLSQDDRSSQERSLVAKEGLRLFLDAPVFGHGIAATQEWNTRVSTHNMYLLLGAEQGIVGVFLFLGLLLILWRCGTREARIVAVLYAASGVFSHNNFEQPAMQILVAVTVAGANRDLLAGRTRVPDIVRSENRERG